MKYLCFFALAVAALIGGLYLTGGIAPRPIPHKTATHRFALTDHDAREAAEAPELAVDAGGRVYLAWPSKANDSERILSLATSDDGGMTFAPPRVVARSSIVKPAGKSKAREARMVPHVVTSDGAVHLAWTETPPGQDGVRMVAATSANRGDTFAAPVTVHHGDGARPTYTSLAAGPGGSLLAAWLDNRNGSQQMFAAVRPAGSAAFDAEQIVHAGETGRGVCPCCPTASLLAPDGTAYVAFRNIAGEHRDIVVGRKHPGDTGYDLFPIVPPTWSFNGCPHDGPSLALVGDVLHAVWMDAHTGSSRCYHATANVKDMKFTTQPLHEIPEGSQGHPSLLADAGGVVYAVWEESRDSDPAPAEAKEGSKEGHKHNHAPPTPGGSGRAIMTATLAPGTTSFGPPRSIAPRTGAIQMRPSLAIVGGNLLVAWNELDDAGKAVVVSMTSAAR